jgi:hypothetical protein
MKMKPFGNGVGGQARSDESGDPLTPENANLPASTKGGVRRLLDFTSPSGRSPSREIPPSPRQESPLRNLLINIILPVIVLNLVSGHGSKPWHLGPVLGLAIAVAMPLAYGVWFFMRTRRANALSIAGMGSVLLTGGITWAAWRPDGSVDGSLFTVFAVKEALLPTVIGLCVLLSQWTSTPLIRLFIFNAQVFEIPRIDQALNSEGTRKEFETALRNAAFVLAGTFMLSGATIFFLTLHFLGAVDATAPNARELYNKAISMQMLWGFVAIGIPFVLVAGGILVWLLKRLEQLTRLKRHLLMTLR